MSNQGTHELPIHASDFDDYAAEKRSIEGDFFREVRRSRFVAWLVAGAFGAFGVGCLAHSFYVESLVGTPSPPFILRVDNATGATEVVSVMSDGKTSYGEVLDRHWLTEYVRHHESYDYQTILYDYNATGLMSSSTVATDYHHIYEGNDRRDQVLADKARIVVTIEAPPVIDRRSSTAVVRFITTQHWLSGNQPDTVNHWIATIAYRYVAAPMKESDRLINPLGFQVTSYRVDPELGLEK